MLPLPNSGGILTAGASEGSLSQLDHVPSQMSLSPAFVCLGGAAVS